jgi:hypothetical protein
VNVAMLPVSICYRRFIAKLATWLLVLSPALSAERCSKNFATKDSKRGDVSRRRGCCCMDDTSTSISSIIASALIRGGSSSSDESTHSKNILSSYSSLSTKTSTRRRNSLPQLLSSQHGRRNACSFYIWNAPSALLHRWCHHLQRDNIYEGLGGKKVSCSAAAGC